MMALSRRELLKSLAGIPFLGAFAFEFARKWRADNLKKNIIVKELALQDTAPAIKPVMAGNAGNKLIRLGIIGFGTRGTDLARSLGFGSSDWVDGLKRRERENSADTRYSDWMMQEDLNVQITGICDVFDMRAEAGLAVARSDAKVQAAANPVKYRHYQEMLESKDIDAVIITTPDFHHAQMAIDAANAGKHVYCEKCMTINEKETHQVYDAVRNSNIVFQLGHQSTQDDIFQKAREIISRDVLGKITMIETNTNRNTSDGAWIRHLDAKGQPKPGDETTIDWQQWLGNSPQVPFSIDRYYNWTKWFAYSTGLSGQLFSHEYDAMNQTLALGIPASAVSSGGIYYYKDNREIPDVFHTVFEFPDRDMTLTYSASLASSVYRPRTIYGHDAMMQIGREIKVHADKDSERYSRMLSEGTIDTDTPIFAYRSGAGQIDAITSATEKFYASRGLLYTFKDGKRADVSHLHLKNWLDAIRDGITPVCNIDRAFEVTIACHMATKSYRENRRVIWDPVQKHII